MIVNIELYEKSMNAFANMVRQISKELISTPFAVFGYFLAPFLFFIHMKYPHLMNVTLIILYILFSISTVFLIIKMIKLSMSFISLHYGYKMGLCASIALLFYTSAFCESYNQTVFDTPLQFITVMFEAVISVWVWKIIFLFFLGFIHLIFKTRIINPFVENFDFHKKLLISLFCTFILLNILLFAKYVFLKM